MYRCLLVDNDNTLMDFSLAEYHALRAALSAFDLPAEDAVCSLYKEINDGLWKKLEKGETTLAQLKEERFRQLLDVLARPDIFAMDLCERYEQELSCCAYLLPGARELVERVSAVMPVALVSNGISRIQRGRLSRCPITAHLSAVVISEEVGVAKPDPAMITVALEALGVSDPRDAVMLGDSLSADIACANAAGVDSIWLAPAGKRSDKATHTVHTLESAEKLILKGY